jgi:competence protein ComEA
MEDWLERYRGYILIILINFILTGGAVILLNRPEPTPIVISEPPPTPTPRPILVYVSGAVENPDVYPLQAEAIVKEAIQAAGGATEEADLERINLAKKVHDGEHIHVPKIGEDVGPLMSEESDRININTATLEELDSLPGIGPVYAQRIVEYRTQKGPFKTIEEIMNVPGIGEKMFEKIKDLITVD